MARISLQEQYENKDVIQQINILKDDVNRVSETTENVNKDIIQQINNVKDDITKVSETTEEVGTLAQQASDTADTAVTTIQGSVTSGSIVADTVSAKLKLNKVSGGSEDSVIPIASASQTGMMNAQTYAGITNLDARVSVLEGKSSTMYVTFPNDDPEQSIITSTFQTKAGRPPVGGDYAVDITRNLTYGYDGSVWVKVDTDVPIPQFSIDTPGLIKGNDEDGTVFAEADGTGSIKGWDALKQSVTNNSTAIAQNSTAIEQNSTAIASKLDKNAGIENAGKIAIVDSNGDYVPQTISLSPFTDYTITNTDDFISHCSEIKVGDTFLGTFKVALEGSMAFYSGSCISDDGNNKIFSFGGYVINPKNNLTRHEFCTRFIINSSSATLYMTEMNDNTAKTYTSPIFNGILRIFN